MHAEDGFNEDDELREKYMSMILDAECRNDSFARCIMKLRWTARFEDTSSDTFVMLDKLYPIISIILVPYDLLTYASSYYCRTDSFAS